MATKTKAKTKPRTKAKTKNLPKLDTEKGARDYFRDLRKIVAKVNSKTAKILATLEAVGEIQATAEERALDKTDAVKKTKRTLTRQQEIKKRRIRAAIDSAESSFVNTLSIPEVKAIAGRNADKTDKANRQQVFTQLRASIGAARLDNPSTTKERANFVKKNVSEIKTIGPKHFERVRKILDDGFKNGMSSRVMAEKIKAVGGVTERRAALIARDQVGSLNANLTKERHVANGFTSFIWTTVGDDRVRDEHEEINGQEFSYATGAPGEGFPGDPIACRCFAVPVFGKG